jgi:hypothetical protein
MFTLQVAKIDPETSTVTFKVCSTSNARKMAVSRFFVLRTLALDGRDDLAVCRALRALLASLSPPEREQRLTDPRTVDRFILRTRITAIENYIDWESIDHSDVLAKLLVRMKLPSSYHLEVHFSDPAHLAGFKVGPRLTSNQADGWIPGIEALLRTGPDNLYTFKGDDEHWRLHDFLATYNTYGEYEIAWTNAEDSVTAGTNGVLPFKESSGWGAVDRDGRKCIAFAYEDYDYHDGRLVFWDEERWIPAADLIGAPHPSAPRPPDPDAVTREGVAIRAAQVDKYGLTIAQLLRCWIRVFSTRPDIHVLHDTAGPPVSASALAALASQLPAHAHAFAAESGPLHFCWIFKDKLAEVHESSEGYNGGRINLVGFEAVRWHRSHAGGSAAMFDDLQAEGSSFLFHDRGSSPGAAGIIFHNLSERYSQGDVESYLTTGAASAFVWYWPKRGYWEAEEFVARLAAASLPRTTPADEVVAGLRARGLDELEAQAVQRWLGPAATLLLPA